MDREAYGLPPFQFGDALYFTIVTLTTVYVLRTEKLRTTVNVFTDPTENARSGYGDYSPTTTLGKATMSGFILLFVVLLPIQINQLQSVMRMQSQFRTTYRKGFREHVVIVGNTNAAMVSPL